MGRRAQTIITTRSLGADEKGHGTMQTIEVRLAQGKETKGTFRYETDDPNAAVSTLYIRKSAFAGGSVPKAIVLKIEADDQERSP
jgi:hypothetical protein